MRRARGLRLLAALVLLLGSVALAGCGGGDDEGAGGGGNGGETTTAAAGGEGDAQAGADVFASNGCGSCHTLEAAGSSGTTGPNLDDLKPSHDASVEQVTNGGGGMPAFGDKLSEQEINDVAAYIVESTQG